MTFPVTRRRPAVRRAELTYVRTGSQSRRAADEAFDQRRQADGGSQLVELGDAEYHQGVAPDGIDQRPRRPRRPRR